MDPIVMSNSFQENSLIWRLIVSIYFTLHFILATFHIFHSHVQQLILVSSPGPKMQGTSLYT